MQATGATGTTGVREPSNVEKTASEPVVSLSLRAPESIAEYLRGRPEGITGTILESVELKRDLDALLESVRGELVRVAAELGKEYTFSQAETLAHIIKRCIASPSKSKK